MDMNGSKCHDLLVSQKPLNIMIDSALMFITHASIQLILSDFD